MHRRSPFVYCVAFCGPSPSAAATDGHPPDDVQHLTQSHPTAFLSAPLLASPLSTVGAFVLAPPTFAPFPSTVDSVLLCYDASSPSFILLAAATELLPARICTTAALVAIGLHGDGAATHPVVHFPSPLVVVPLWAGRSLGQRRQALHRQRMDVELLVAHHWSHFAASLLRCSTPTVQLLFAHSDSCLTPPPYKGDTANNAAHDLSPRSIPGDAHDAYPAG